jgi:hypothetical protein
MLEFISLILEAVFMAVGSFFRLISIVFIEGPLAILNIIFGVISAGCVGFLGFAVVALILLIFG